MKKRCERNIAGRDEDTAVGVAYTPCGKSATHMVRQRGHEEWAACDEHAAEAESDGCEIELREGSR